jgi:predicted ArsR family transcriptional regulator
MADATVSAAGLRIIKLLIGNPPFTISDLIKATGVTRTAVTEQLNDLVSTGFVEQSAERLTGRGRPRHLYKATERALIMLFSSHQRMVVPAIWKAISEIGGDELSAKVLKRVSTMLAEHYINKITAKGPEARLCQLMDLLIAEGGILETVEENGQLVLYKRSCPFVTMVDENQTACHIDLDMIAQIVGHPVRRIACRHEGDFCCKVEIDHSPPEE